MSGSLPAEGRWSQADTRHRSLQAKRLHCLISFQITLALLDIVQEIHNVMFGVFEYGCLATRGNTHHCQILLCWFTIVFCLAVLASASLW